MTHTFRNGCPAQGENTSLMCSTQCSKSTAFKYYRAHLIHLSKMGMQNTSCTRLWTRQKQCAWMRSNALGCAGLLDSWWEFAVLLALHIYTRTPIKCLNWLTPYEKLHGEAPTINHLRVFGCGTYVHIPPETWKNKLAPKSELMIYLGVAPGDHGNIFMCLPNNVLYTSAHALFDESMCPKCADRNKRLLTHLPDVNPDAPLGSDDEEEPHYAPQKSPRKGKGKAQNDTPVLLQPMEHTPNLPPDLPEVGPAPLRRSGREQRTPARPDNIYRDRSPVEQFKSIRE